MLDLPIDSTSNMLDLEKLAKPSSEIMPLMPDQNTSTEYVLSEATDSFPTALQATPALERAPLSCNPNTTIEAIPVPITILSGGGVGGPDSTKLNVTQDSEATRWSKCGLKHKQVDMPDCEHDRYSVEAILCYQKVQVDKHTYSNSIHLIGAT
jgi:hypothetical protein